MENAPPQIDRTEQIPDLIKLITSIFFFRIISVNILLQKIKFLHKVQSPSINQPTASIKILPYIEAR